MTNHPTRRQFLKSASQLASAAAVASALPVWAAEEKKPLKIAAVVTCFVYRSHAHCILENFLEPYLFNGQVTQPGMTVAGLYVDEFLKGDMSRQVAKDYGITIYPTIAEALKLGGKELAVDAVLSIGEHGEYPVNEKGQSLLPRKRFFDEIAAVCRQSGRGIPIFNDKHLSYRWDWAKEMYDTAKKLDMPFMAGSSVPLAERRPPLEIPPGSKITDILSLHAGGVESYDFHSLEAIQSLAEFRAGGETGMQQVEFLEGEALWKAADDGKWSIEMAQAAMSAEIPVGGKPELVTAIGNRGRKPDGTPVEIHGILLRYKDGLRGMVLKVAGAGSRWGFACKLEGDKAPRASTFFVGPWNNRCLFKALSHAIQNHFRERAAPYPVERTLFTTGILAAAMDSRYARRPIDTPDLPTTYATRDFTAMREMGATWKILTQDLPEPKGIYRMPR